MVPFLPPIIKNLDPQKVMDWSKPMRAEYREEMNKRRASNTRPLEWIMQNLDRIEAFRKKRVKGWRLSSVRKDDASVEARCSRAGIAQS